MKSMLAQPQLLITLGLFVFGGTYVFAAKSLPTKGTPGKYEGSMYWVMPNTPNGLQPVNSWHAIGSVPDGDFIYASGMDHKTNSATYQIDVATNILYYVGDAKSASTAANRWNSAETMEKFHSRPSWYKGKVYLSGLDASYPTDDYKLKRGLHWYAYDQVKDEFSDISSPDGNLAIATPDGTGGVRTFTVDAERGRLYGIQVPMMNLLYYDIATKKTEVLGRTPTMPGNKPLYVPGFTWIDSRGRFYFSSGNLPGGIIGYPLDTYGFLHYWDTQKTGTLKEVTGTLPTFKLHPYSSSEAQPNAQEVGQCVLNNSICFVATDHGHLYQFEDQGPTWNYLGKIPPGRGMWTLYASLDGRFVYLLTSNDRNSGACEFYQYSASDKKIEKLGGCTEIDPSFGLNGAFDHSGYDAWDKDGRFYTTSYKGWESNTMNTVVTRIDPVRLKVALKKLPELIKVGLEKTGTGLTLTRTGSTASNQSVAIAISWKASSGWNEYHYFMSSIPSGSPSIAVTNEVIKAKSPANATDVVVSIVNAGSDYVADVKNSASLSVGTSILRHQKMFKSKITRKIFSVNGRTGNRTAHQPIHSSEN